MTQKLYQVRCRGLTNNLGSRINHGLAYAVAEDPNQAYQKVLRSLLERDIGFSHERELDSVTLLAEQVDFPLCGFTLYL
jgi:hypothetical protein